ncbi:alpha/beta hydrolase [Acerihabitans sp. TG2]|uniref:RBBP9/YdeN family alpha/beta hydrolase n=1 Tax=Acerihabitans sp. TG2 TaxID=3096008 RepID=UPI002B22E129|nr:alpha/beta hydrolase [Acerihabitans sp. TG2]MEA9391920.1 alpha/beta hydrolase [Acerihabitans sp. TG2]
MNRYSPPLDRTRPPPNGPVGAINDDALCTVLVPGINDSGPEHWQSLWGQSHPQWRRIAQRDWLQPDLDGWLSAIRRAIGNTQAPVLLIGHSFGALSSWYYASRFPGQVAGVVLVAPAEPVRFEIEDRITAAPLPVPSLMFASHNDPLLTINRARHWAQAWGAELVDVGDAGHINAQAGFGAWPHGLERVEEFARQLRGPVR